MTARICSLVILSRRALSARTGDATDADAADPPTPSGEAVAICSAALGLGDKEEELEGEEARRFG